VVWVKFKYFKIKKDNMSEKKEKTLREIVVENVKGGKSRQIGFVKDNDVFITIYGGKNICIGYVKNGTAYQRCYGGKDRVIGYVKKIK